MNFKSWIGLICSSLLVVSAVYSEEIQKEFQVEPGKTLFLYLKTGADVRIEGWDQSVVQVDGSITGMNPDNLDVRVEETAAGVEIRTRYKGRHHDSYNSDGEFNIRVPSRFNVDIDSMGGDITILNVDGRFDGSTMGGRLELSGLNGKISLSTMGGDVSLTRSHLDGEVSTMGGEVQLEEVSGNVKGSTMGGNVVQKKSSGTGKSGVVEMSSMGGELNLDDAPAGAELSTMGGDIHIVSAKDHVKAKTMGGDIRIDSIDGWVHAETMGGDVEVKMTGDASTGKRDVELVSYGGDIELTVPQNLSMTLDVELAYTRGNSGRYSIKSDFPVETEETKEWVHDGTPRKYIYGSGKVGTGEHRVRIQTINGNVILKKSS